MHVGIGQVLKESTTQMPLHSKHGWMTHGSRPLQKLPFVNDVFTSHFASSLLKVVDTLLDFIRGLVKMSHHVPVQKYVLTAFLFSWGKAE